MVKNRVEEHLNEGEIPTLEGLQDLVGALENIAEQMGGVSPIVSPIMDKCDKASFDALNLIFKHFLSEEQYEKFKAGEGIKIDMTVMGKTILIMSDKCAEIIADRGGKKAAAAWIDKQIHCLKAIKLFRHLES